jgi:hypothetical protein
VNLNFILESTYSLIFDVKLVIIKTNKYWEQCVSVLFGRHVLIKTRTNQTRTYQNHVLRNKLKKIQITFLNAVELAFFIKRALVGKTVMESKLDTSASLLVKICFNQTI